MARTAQAKSAKNLPAKAGTGDLPAVADDFFAGPDGFGGVDSADIALPRFTILQALSTQVNKRHADYIQGAEPGMIMNAFPRIPIEDEVRLHSVTVRKRFLRQLHTLVAYRTRQNNKE